MKLASFVFFSVAVHSAVLLYPVDDQHSGASPQRPVTLVYSTATAGKPARPVPLSSLQQPQQQSTAASRESRTKRHTPPAGTDTDRHALDQVEPAVQPAKIAAAGDALPATMSPQPAALDARASKPASGFEEEFWDEDTTASVPVATSQQQRAAVNPPAPATYTQASFAHAPAPTPPDKDRREGRGGRVMLRVLVNVRGEPKRVEIAASSGSESLDQAAVQAIKLWRFNPARRNNSAVESWVKFPVDFRLADANKPW